MLRRYVTKKLLEAVYKVSFEIMRKAQIELSILRLRDQAPITEAEVLEELMRMGESDVFRVQYPGGVRSVN